MNTTGTLNQLLYSFSALYISTLKELDKGQDLTPLTVIKAPLKH